VGPLRGHHTPGKRVAPRLGESPRLLVFDPTLLGREGQEGGRFLILHPATTSMKCRRPTHRRLPYPVRGSRRGLNSFFQQLDRE
jgi:hypothetical protein